MVLHLPSRFRPQQQPLDPGTAGACSVGSRWPYGRNLPASWRAALLSMLPWWARCWAWPRCRCSRSASCWPRTRCCKALSPACRCFWSPSSYTPARRNTQLQLCFSFALLAGADPVGRRAHRWRTATPRPELMTQPKPDLEALAQGADRPALDLGAPSCRFGGLGVAGRALVAGAGPGALGGQGAMHALFSSTLALWRNKGPLRSTGSAGCC